MTHYERWGSRDPGYSIWHRVASIKRFIGEGAALHLAMIDLDIWPSDDSHCWPRFCERCGEPTFLLEAAVDIGQQSKAAYFLRSLAVRAKLPGWVVLYRKQSPRPEADLIGFRIRPVAPVERTSWIAQSPQEHAEWLYKFYQDHHLSAHSQRLVLPRVAVTWPADHSDLPSFE